jgi:hypothetical protein
MFRHKSKRKGKKGESSSSSKARSGMSTDLFAVIVLPNFYLHVLIHYYFIASYLIYFIIVFVCSAFLGALDDEGQLEMAGAWREVSAAHQEAPEVEPEVRVAHQELAVRAA